MKKVPMIYLVTLLLLLSSLSPVSADFLYDRSGSLVYIDGSVLGEETVHVEGEGESKTAIGEHPSENSKKVEEQRREQAKKVLEKQIVARKKAQEKNESQSRLEINQVGDKLKLKQETKDKSGLVVTKETELKDGEALHIEEKNGEHTELRPKLEAKFDDKVAKLEIIKDKIKSETILPLVVNEQNELTLTKKDGTTKILTILPDEAKAKLVERGILTQDTDSAPELTTNESGEPVYSVHAQAKRRVLGLFNLDFKTKSEVDVESGNVTTNVEEVSPWRQLLFRWSR